MKRRTVIVAAGDFPRRGGEAWQLLANAARVICCDSAADAYRRRFRRNPEVVIGDGDSVRGQYPCRVIVEEQETNDLEKAMRYCRANGWKDAVIVGATGRREDHAIGNVFRALDYGLEIVTDTGRFVPFCGRLSLKVEKGAAISVFAPDPSTQMTSRGLEWPLDKVIFNRLYCATLNRASAVRIVITSTRPAYIFIAK